MKPQVVSEKRVATVSAVLSVGSSGGGPFWRWSSYNHFALDKATAAACSIQIDDVKLPLRYRAGEKSTDRNALSVATRSAVGMYG